MAENFPIQINNVFMLIEMNGEISDINDPVEHSFDQYRNIVKEISSYFKMVRQKIFQISVISHPEQPIQYFSYFISNDLQIVEIRKCNIFH